jgi:hypothetical protein
MQQSLLAMLARFGLLDAGSGVVEPKRPEIMAPFTSAQGFSPMLNMLGNLGGVVTGQASLEGQFYSSAEVLGVSRWPQSLRHSMQTARVKLQVRQTTSQFTH